MDHVQGESLDVNENQPLNSLRQKKFAIRAIIKRLQKKVEMAAAAAPDAA